MPLDTQLPAWLQRNLAPREPFDPTPWLQERYRRNVAAQEIPLRLQHMALVNQSAQLDIAHQGMVNDVQADELRRVQDEQPLMAQWMKETQGRPDLILNSPAPSVMSQRNQQVILNARKMAADTAFGRAMALQETAKVQRLTHLVNRGGELPEPTKDPVTGAMTYRDADISAAERAVDEREQQQWMERIQAQTGWHYDEFGNPVQGAAREPTPIAVSKRIGELTAQLRASQAKTLEPNEGNPEYQAELARQASINAELDSLRKGTAIAKPEIQVVGGEQYVVNPRTGHYEKLNKAPSKEQFIAANIVKWAADHMEDAAAAAQQLGEVYDQSIKPQAGGAPATPPASASGWKQVGGFKVRIPPSKP